MTTQNKQNDSNWGLMIFKDTFDYLIDGDMTDTEFCILMRCIYNLRQNGELPNEEELPKAVKLVWKTLKHSISKSATNSKYYNNKKKTTVKKDTNDNHFCPWTEDTPTDEPFSSELYMDPVLEEDFQKNEPQELPETLTEFFDGHTEGIMRNADWHHFSDEFKDAEKIRELSGLGVITCMTLYNDIRKKLLKK